MGFSNSQKESSFKTTGRAFIKMKSAKEFFEDITKTANQFFFVVDFNVIIEDGIIVRGKVLLKNGLFVEVYFNEENQKTSFALLKGGERIFGVDNLGGWHVHLFENPASHQRCGECSFKEFLIKIKLLFK